MRFKDKVAVITGAGQGIGEAYAVALAEQGAGVVIAEIDKLAGQRVANTLIKEGHDALFVETDIASVESCNALAETVTERFGGVDFLVNNAAIFEDSAVWNMDTTTWEKVVDTGLKGVLVDIVDTIKAFTEILDGKYDQYPEAAFNLKGGIEDVIEAGEKMLAENA